MNQNNSTPCHSCSTLNETSAVICKNCGTNLVKPKSQPFTFTAIALLLAGLALFAPSKSEFIEYISVGFHEKINNSELSENQLAEGIAKGMVNVLLEYSVHEKNFYVFKIFTLDMHLARIFNKNIDNIKFLGIAGSFFPLSNNLPETLFQQPNDTWQSNRAVNTDEYKSNTPNIESAVEKTYDLHAKTEVFIDEIFNSLSANNDIALRVVEKYWAPVVVLDGYKVSKNSLASRKIEFFQKWPLRNYISNPTMQEIECDRSTQICKVEGMVNWGLENYKGTKKIKGSSEYEFTIDFSRETPLITEESMKVIQK